MLMSLLAVDLREAGVPVLFIRRGVVPPDLNQIDQFAVKLEAVAKIPIVILYDGLVADYEYLKVAQFLSGRGRKAVVVGTSYRTPPISNAELEGKEESRTRRERRAQTSQMREKRRRTRTIDIQVKIEPPEHDALINHLAGFLPQDRDTLRELSSAGYDNFFAVLYHLLEPARLRLRENLVREIELSVGEFNRAFESHQRSTSVQRANFETSMERALRGALGKIVTLESDTASDETDDSSQARSAGYGVVRLIMLASRFNIATPQSIALALLRGYSYELYRHIFEWCHVLEARPIDGGEVTLHARQRLEAELWCEKKIPSDDQRFQIIRDLIGGLDARMLRLVNEDERSPEHEFVTRLLRTIGPQGPEPLRLHGRFYQKVAEIVHDLQDRTRVIHPRLLLIQSNATRESVQYQQYFADAPDKPDASSDRIEGLVHGWLNDLRRAEQALIEAREAVESQRSHGQASLPRGARQLLSVLETERACILGVQQGCLKRVVRHYESRRHWLEEQKTDRMLTDAKREELAALPGRIEGKYPEMDGYLNKARLAWRSSLAIDENNHRALDSACWILRDRFESGGMSDERRGELCAEWNEVLDTYSELDLSDEELDQYETRDWQYRREIGDVEGLRTVFEAMAKRNLPGAINLEARYKQQTEGPAAARAFLEERLRPQDILSNRSTLLLYYRLWWNAEAHLPSFFDKSSLCLPFSEAQWRRLAELAESYLTLDGERDNNMALFHLGWARLQLGESHRSGEVLDHLATVSLSHRRGRSLA